MKTPRGVTNLIAYADAIRWFVRSPDWAGHLRESETCFIPQHWPPESPPSWVCEEGGFVLTVAPKAPGAPSELPPRLPLYHSPDWFKAKHLA